MQNKLQTINSPKYAKKPIQLQHKRQGIPHSEYYINEGITNENTNLNQKILIKKVS